MAQKEEYLKKMRALMEEWDREIVRLGEMDLTHDLKREYAEQVERMRPRMADVRTRMEELERAGEHAWEDLKAGMDMAWDSLSEAMRTIRSRFGK